MPLRTLYTFLANYRADMRERKFLAALPPPQTFAAFGSHSHAGRTVIAAKEIAPGTLVGIYPGRRTTKEEFYEKEPFVERSIKYAYTLPNGVVLDPTDLFGNVPSEDRMLLALINEPPPGCVVNILPISSRRYNWYVALRGISPNEELFTTYGPNYRRDYETDLAATSGKVPLTEADRLVLRGTAERYPWLRAGIHALLPGA